ncbi:unnamed protein product [Bursaphelenchus okinawaensis]|uniref:ANK_REP_REGION domain-containing protein n=1 Tax=Bursaphelenchus okinawaensis TaxID=465554 RepID=A0A811LCA3_9BILA|nr:unnamed protein product [Bursaphelenchus okinawaensis]CAG9120288.1 unnamed protein product [Bursaphelenchus okinawaensis]
MSRKLGADSREVKNLRQKLKQYKENGNVGGQVEMLAQLGDEYRQLRQNEEALEFYTEAVKLAQRITKYEDLAHCHRNIASILSEDNADAARKHIKLFLTYAKKLGDHNLIQLALHEYAFIYQGFASHDKEYLLEAFEKALQCKQYLTKHARDIDSDKEAVKTAENSKRRMAGINSLLAEIFQCFGDYSTALKYNNMAVDYAQSVKDYELLYSCLLMKVELTKGEKKVAIAKQRMDIAHQYLKHNSNESELEFAKQALNFYPEDFEDLAPALKCLLKLRKNSKYSAMSKAYLEFIWKYEKRTADLKKNIANGEKFKICERIADSAVELRLFEVALTYYKNMLKYASNFKNQEKSLISVAETLKDVGDFKTASEYYDKCLGLIRRNFQNDKFKVLETEVNLAVTRSKDTSLPADIRFKYLKDLLNKGLRNQLQLSVVEAIVMLIHVNRQQYNANEIEKWTNEWKDKRKECIDSQDDRSEDEVEDGEDEDEYDNISEKEMIYDLEARYTTYEQKNTFEKKKNCRNTKGETLLHEAARDGELEKVKQLLQCKYDVNAKDYGGWTPLSEAVNHGHLDISRVLLQHGAEVDCQSGQALLNDDGTACDSAGDTPLMEACANGHLDVARLLIAFKASVSRTNHNGYSALYFLKSYIDNHEMDSKRKGECERLVREIEAKQRKEGFQEKENLIEVVPPTPSTSTAPFRAHSPVQIVNDMAPKKGTKKQRRRQISVDDTFDEEMECDFEQRLQMEDQSFMDTDIYVANDEGPTTMSRGGNIEDRRGTEGSVYSRQSKTDSSRASRKRAASPSSTSTGSAKRSAIRLQNEVRSRSDRSEIGDSGGQRKKKKRHAFSKRLFITMNPLTNQPVTIRRSFEDDGVDIDEYISKVDQIFTNRNE